jgi:SAM-dependent methyltransferase
MTHGFDQGYWESHWRQASGRDGEPSLAPNPYLVAETVGLVPGSALDAGCGEGAEASWLAAQGWQVTAVDISAEALVRARGRAVGRAGSERVEWVEADLTVWAPDQWFALVTTHYAHPATAQLDFYERLSGWVAPGGTLLVVGHLHRPGSPPHGHPPEEVSVTAASICARLDATAWEVVTAAEHVRTVGEHAGHPVTLDDVVVRATLRAPNMG